MGWVYRPYYESLKTVWKNGINMSAGEPDRANLKPCLKNFFNHHYIQKLLKNNDWATIIECWYKDWVLHRKKDEENLWGNYPGWPITYLTDFLYYNGIDFWNYLPPTYDDRIFSDWFDSAKDGSTSLLVWRWDN